MQCNSYVLNYRRTLLNEVLAPKEGLNRPGFRALIKIVFWLHGWPIGFNGRNTVRLFAKSCGFKSYMDPQIVVFIYVCKVSRYTE